MKKIVFIFVLLLTQILFSQEETIPVKENITPYKQINSRKGQFFASWGWNRSSYGKSDITFTGDDHNFTLYDVKADDKPESFGIRFIDPANLTIPQTNYRLGYFITDNYNIIIGADHMKYVMRANQNVLIDGEISTGGFNSHSIPYNYDNTYNNETINLSPNFLKFEHTDGLNYIFAGLNRFDNFNQLLRINTKNFQVNLEEGVDLGVYMPRSNVTMLGHERYDEFHFAGFGFSAKAGLNLTFFNHFYLQTDFKYGYVNMPSIRTTKDSSDNAKQHFSFFEAVYSFGYRFKI